MSESKDKNEPDEACEDNDDRTVTSSSPSASPRDKKTRRGAEGDNTIPESQTARRQLTAKDLLIAASPPKFINLEDVMRLANGMTDMALAHEIAVSNEFRVEELQPDPGSLEGRIKEVMHKAFWDVLSESLNEDPPDYTHALVLLGEVKKGLQDLLLPHHQRLRAAIDEALDLELIEQQAAHGVLDFQRYATFIINTMASLCAPVRDELIASLRSLTDVVPLYREILKALRLLKMDLVNFTISQVRPYVQQHSVEYERNKFQSLLDLQKENGVDGLEFTRDWLSRAVSTFTQRSKAEHGSVTPVAVAMATESVSLSATSAGTSNESVSTTESASISEGATCSSSGTNVSLSPAPLVTAVLNIAYLEILDWDDDRVFPETLLIDQRRFIALRDQVRWLIVIASTLIVTYSTVGATISGLSELKNKLTHQICLLTKHVPNSKLSETMLNVSEQVNKDVNQSLHERGFSEMNTEQQQLLKGQIVAIVEPGNVIHRLMKERLMSFISKVLSNPHSSQPRDVQLPAGYSSVTDELSSVLGQFLHLVNYNQTVFAPYYTEIITGAVAMAAMQGEVVNK